MGKVFSPRDIVANHPDLTPTDLNLAFESPIPENPLFWVKLVILLVKTGID